MTTATATHPRTEKTTHEVKDADRATTERIADQADTIFIYAFIGSRDSRVGPCVKITRDQLTALLDALERTGDVCLRLSYWPNSNLWIL